MVEAKTERGKRRWWPRWGTKALVESLLIVFSVVLALMVSEWADQRRTAARAREMRGFLIAEIEANRALLAGDTQLPHHRRLKLAFTRAAQVAGDTIDPVEARPAVRALLKTGLHQAAPQDAVWTSIVSTDLLGELAPREMFALARLYRSQEGLSTLNRTGYEQATGLLDVLSGQGGAGSATRPTMRMILFLEDLVAFETGLVRQYDATLAVLAADEGKT